VWRRIIPAGKPVNRSVARFSVEGPGGQPAPKPRKPDEKKTATPPILPKISVCLQEDANIDPGNQPSSKWMSRLVDLDVSVLDNKGPLHSRHSQGLASASWKQRLPQQIRGPLTMGDAPFSPLIDGD